MQIVDFEPEAIVTYCETSEHHAICALKSTIPRLEYPGLMVGCTKINHAHLMEGFLMQIVGFEPEAILPTASLANTTRYAHQNQPSPALIEGFLMQIVGFEPEAIVTYCEIGEKRAICAKITHQDRERWRGNPSTINGVNSPIIRGRAYLSKLLVRVVPLGDIQAEGIFFSLFATREMSAMAVTIE